MNGPRADQVAGVFLHAFAPFFKTLARIFVPPMLVLGAFLLVCLAFLALASQSPASLERTIANSRKLEADFHIAAAFVESFRAEHGRLPDNAEFSEWGGRSIMRIEAGYPNSEAIAHFGKTPEDDYLLVIWRGEWEEFYASWSGETSLKFDPSDYTLLGSRWADAAMFAVGAMLLITALSLFTRSTDVDAVPQVDSRGPVHADVPTS